MKQLLLLSLLLSNIVNAQISCIYTPELIPFKKGSKYGFINKNKEIIIKPQFDKVSIFSLDLDVSQSNGSKYSDNSYATVNFKNKRYRINKKGDFIVQLDTLKFDTYDPYRGIKKQNQIIKTPIGNDTAYKIISNNGSIIVEEKKYNNIEYLFFDNSFDKYFLVSKDNKTGIIDDGGNIIVPLIYDSLSNLNYFAGVIEDGIIFEYKIGKETGILDLCNQKY